MKLPARNHRAPAAVMAVLWCALACVMAMTACGKKADPRYIAEAAAFTVRDIAATNSGEAIRVGWRINGDARAVARVRIFRALVRGNDCSGCSREYLRIADLAASDQSFVTSEEGTISFLDASAVKCEVYSYRIVLCAGDGTCAESAESAGISFP